LPTRKQTETDTSKEQVIEMDNAFGTRGLTEFRPEVRHVEDCFAARVIEE